MTLNHNYGCFSGVCSGIAGNLPLPAPGRLELSRVFQRVPNKKARTFQHGQIP